MRSNRRSKKRSLPARRFAIGYSNAARIKKSPRITRPKKEYRTTHLQIGEPYVGTTGGPIPFYRWSATESFHEMQFNGMPSTYDNASGALSRYSASAPPQGITHVDRVGNSIYIDQVKMRLCLSAPHGPASPWTGAFCCRAIVIQVMEASTSRGIGAFTVADFFQTPEDINSFYKSRQVVNAEAGSTNFKYRVLLDKHFTVDSSAPQTEDLQMVFRYKLGNWLVNPAETTNTAHAGGKGRIIWNLFVEKFNDGNGNDNGASIGLLQTRPSYYGQCKFVWHDIN